MAELSLAEYLEILRKRVWLVAGCLLSAVALAVTWSLLQTPLYASTATVLIESGSASQVFDPVTGEARGARAVTNEARFANSDQVRDAAEAALESVGLDVRALQYSVSVTESDDADELRIRASATTANGAAQIAQTFASTYIELSRQKVVQEYLDTAEVIQSRLDEVEARLNALGDSDSTQRGILEAQLESFSSVRSSLDVTAELGGGSRQIIGRARIPAAPFTPNTQRNVIVGAVLGLLAGVGLAVLFDALDTSVSSKDEIEALTKGAPNLAVVPTVVDWRERATTRIVTIEAPQSPTAEAYRTLRASLDFATIDRDVKILQVTSANPGEGKTTTAVNLAVALARAGRRVVLLDADLRKPRLQAFFDLAVEPGLTNSILGQVPPTEVGHLVERDAGSLTVVTSGPLPPGPSELLGSERTTTVLRQLEEMADIVIVDSAPVLPVSDALVLAKKVDATLLVANGRRTTSTHLEDAIELLLQVEANVIGTVLNEVKRGRGAAGYGYGYGYGYEEAGDRSSDETPSRIRSLAGRS